MRPKMSSEALALKGMQNAINIGRNDLQAGRYKAAIDAFQDSLSACTCTRNRGRVHSPTANCLIAAITKAARSSDIDAIYKAAKCRCACRERKPMCGYKLHKEALDKLAACYAALGFYDDAAKYAAALIHLSPESPMGYCRFSKVLRLQIARQQPCSFVTDPAATTAAIVKQGLHNVQAYGDTSDALYKVLQVIHFKISRADPFERFTNELKVMIFAYLRTSDLCASMRVSKGWLHAIQDDPRLWASVTLGQIKYAPTRSAFAKLIQRAQRARSLCINDAKTLGLDHAKFEMIFAIQSLWHLTIRGPPVSYPFDPSYAGHYPTGLRSLTLTGITALGNETLLTNMLRYSIDTLQSVSLIGTREFALLHIPLAFPNLRALRLQTSIDGSTQGVIHDMNHLIAATPNLEQLYLDAYNIRFNPTNILGHPIHPFGWSKLRVLILGEHLRIETDPALGRSWPWLPTKELRAIEILSESPSVAREVLWAPELVPMGFEGFEQLEVFRCRSPINYAQLEKVVGSSFRSGSLRVLDIPASECLTIEELNQFDETAIAPQMFPFTSESLHTFGLSKFFFEDLDSYNGLFTARPFLDLIGKFPNVDTVAAYPSAYARCADIIKALLFHKGIKRIYQDCLLGVDRDQVMEMARQKGIEVLHHKKYMPPIFPRDFDFTN